MKVNKNLINSINKQNVINIIRNNGPIFKAEIARLTGLSIPAVMKITEDLIAKNLVRETGRGELNRGKPPQLLEFVSDSHHIIGVDIGTTNIKTIVMDNSAKIVSKKIIPTNIKEPLENVIGRIQMSVEKVIIESDVERKSILGIGLGMPGILDTKAGKVLFSPDFGWENVDLLKPLKERINLPIIIDNVTRVMAIGEKWFGAARNIDNFICINLGFGIGAAIVINGELYKGSSGASGEFGHMIMEKNGPLCACGNFGCLEALASANAMSINAKTSIENGEKTIIIELANGDMDCIDAKIVFDAAKQGDGLAWRIIQEAADYLGIALAGTINFFDPELIILTGGVTQAGNILLDSIKRSIASRQMKYAGGNTKILISGMGSDSAAVGAATLILKVFIENGGNIECFKHYA